MLGRPLLPSLGSPFFLGPIALHERRRLLLFLKLGYPPGQILDLLLQFVYQLLEHRVLCSQRLSFFRRHPLQFSLCFL